jgi:hypothetical protein
MSSSNQMSGTGHLNQIQNNDLAGDTCREAVRASPAATIREDSKTSGESEREQSNVGALIAKSKKVASSLFTLLHAKVRSVFSYFMVPFSTILIINFVSCQQNCRLGVNRCSHPGCPDAKLIHLHLKTCTAAAGSECPSGRKGCVDSRKLLAHSRRCRDIRARQTAGQLRAQQHVCLVCSLVARYAKGGCDLDRSVSPRSRSGSKHPAPSASLNVGGNIRMQTQPKLCAAIRRRSTTPPRGNDSYAVDSSVTDLLGGDMESTPKKMPPPPPRFPFSGGSSIVQNQTQSGSRDGSSLQSATFYAMEATSGNEDVDPATGEEVLGKSLDTAGDFMRPRSESLDIGHSHTTYGRVDIRVTTAIDEYSRPQPELSSFGEVDTKPKHAGRPRSMSCSVPSSSSPRCDTIFEESIDGELKHILDRK